MANVLECGTYFRYAIGMPLPKNISSIGKYSKRIPDQPNSDFTGTSLKEFSVWGTEIKILHYPPGKKII